MVDSMNDWNGPGLRRIKFNNGSYKRVQIARFIHLTSGEPCMVVGDDGSLYPWHSIVWLGPILPPTNKPDVSVANIKDGD
jgi:hypothetical protein